MQVTAARISFSDDDQREISARIAAALTSGRLTLGTNTEEFEARFAVAHAAPFAVAVSSGTAALEIILRSVGVAGRDVIVPANTFAATAFAVQGAGARPVFADVDAATFALSAETVRAVLTPSTAAVVLVHIGGLITPEIAALQRLCDERGVALIEDAAHAHGSQHDGAFAGSFGVAGSFSFYPTKVVTSGEGGMIVTADERIFAEALAFRDQGKASFGSNLHTHSGYAWRMSELHAAVGVVHLRNLDRYLAVRGDVASRYDEHLDALGRFQRLPTAIGAVSSHYKYPVLPQLETGRAELKTLVKQKFDVQLAGEVYEVPLHRQPVFESLAERPLPVAEEICARHVCLPIHSDMRTEEVETVLEALTWASETLR